LLESAAAAPVHVDHQRQGLVEPVPWWDVKNELAINPIERDRFRVIARGQVFLGVYAGGRWRRL
jgi:hypothetical protein